MTVGNQCLLRSSLLIFLAIAGIGAANAACTVPHILTNGQTADATEVMADINAVAGCADAAVAPTGMPTTGSITVFSGAKTVTSGDLSGDVTTSGSTTTTLSNSGVSPGIYGDASHVARVTVDAKGRVTSVTSVPVAGSAGTGLFAQTMSVTPTIAATGLINLQGNSPAQSDTPVGIYLRQSGANGPVQYTNTVPSAPYSFTALMATSASASITGLGWTDGTKMQYIYINNGNIYVQSNTNISTWNSTQVALSGGYNRILNWFKIRDDGTNVEFYYSSDGYNFSIIYSVAKSSGFLGASGYSHILVGSPGGNGPSDVTLMSWTQGN